MIFWSEHPPTSLQHTFLLRKCLVDSYRNLLPDNLLSVVQIQNCASAILNQVCARRGNLAFVLKQSSDQRFWGMP